MLRGARVLSKPLDSVYDYVYGVSLCLYCAASGVFALSIVCFTLHLLSCAHFHGASDKLPSICVSVFVRTNRVARSHTND